MVLNCNGRTLDLSEPKVMGIINVNDQSFYEKSRHNGIDDVLSTASRMIEEGASILDIGAMSSRPGAAISDPSEEAIRIQPIVKALVREVNDHIIISVDTIHSQVAESAIKAGAHMINDISSGDLDHKMLNIVGESQCAYVAMHMKGTPANMQDRVEEDLDIVMEVLKYMDLKSSQIRKAGIKDLIIDVGFGFGKTIKQNYDLLKHMSSFKIFEAPILAGVSRKSMIYKPLELRPEDVLPETSFVHAHCLQNGAKILRVHDVKEAANCIKLHQIISH